MPKIVKIPHPKKESPTETAKTKKQLGRENLQAKKEAKQKFADDLANNPTVSETLMCALLDRLSIKYDFQPIVCGYIPDFIIKGKKKIIELDGKIHKRRKKYDEKRDTILRKKGYKVLRIASNRMFWDADRVTELIKSFVFSSKRKDIPKPKRKKKTVLIKTKDELTESFYFYTEGL